MYNGKLFQPPIFDKFTKWHFILAGIAIICLILVNFGGFVYEFGQATGYGSKEGIDPLDLFMNLMGSFIGVIILRLIYGI